MTMLNMAGWYICLSQDRNQTACSKDLIRYMDIVLISGDGAMFVAPPSRPFEIIGDPQWEKYAISE